MANPTILYNNILTLGTPASTGTDSSTAYSAANVNDYRTYTKWKSDSTAATNYITINCGTSSPANALGIVGHNLYTVGATISVESSTDGTWGGEESTRLSGFSSTHNNAIFKTFSSAIGLHWRVKFTGHTNAPEVACVFLGMKTQMPEQVKIPYLPESVSVVSETKRSKAGNILGSVIRHKPYTIKPKFVGPGLTWNWVNNTYRPFWEDHASEMKPFFWVHDSTTFPNEVKYVTINPKDKFERPIIFNNRVESLSLSLMGIHE